MTMLDVAQVGFLIAVVAVGVVGMIYVIKNDKS